MRKTILAMGVCAMAGLTILRAQPRDAVSTQASPAARHWAQWRGPEATGVSRTATPPIEWSETKNVRWKVEIPGRGSASPIVWGDRVYLLTAVPAGSEVASSHVASRGKNRYVVLALDRKSGKTIWERTAREEE